MSMSRYSTDPSTTGPRRASYAAAAAGRQAASQQASAANSNMNSASASASASREHLVHPSRSMDIDDGVGFTAGGGQRQRSGTNNSTWTSDSLRYGGSGLGCTMHDDHPPSFTPSYLRHSRHVERVQRAWDEHLAKLQEVVGTSYVARPALSASSSSVNLRKMSAPYVHRGVTQDVIERIPPPTVVGPEDPLHPLPGRWSEEDKMAGLEILGDGLEARCGGIPKLNDSAAVSVRSDYPMPKECGIYYFEVTVLSRGKEGPTSIGFSTAKANLSRMPGWEPESWAYHSDDGSLYHGSATHPKAYGPRYGAQDVIGCGVNFRTGNAFFTKNGVQLGTASSGIHGDRLFPSVGMKKPSDHLRANFGKSPFVFDIDRMVEHERKAMAAEIRKTDVSGLHPPNDENALIHNLIRQYLAHEGHVETSKAFAQDIADRQQSLSAQPQPPFRGTDEDDIHAVNRQKIRKSILDGDIDRALKYTGGYYPRVLEEHRNRDTYFRLRCQKFIEMMRRYTELSSFASSPTTATKPRDPFSSNGQGEDPNEPDTQMELDDQLHREASQTHDDPPSQSNDDVDMDASTEQLPPPPSSKRPHYQQADDLLTAIVAYGQELHTEFAPDRRTATKRQLEDLFALVCYPDVRQSPVAHLFDARGRVSIAEEVNGAILVSLGKPSSAALETLSAQTDALLEVAAIKTGSAAAMVNVRRDFLME